MAVSVVFLKGFLYFSLFDLVMGSRNSSLCTYVSDFALMVDVVYLVHI